MPSPLQAERRQESSQVADNTTAAAPNPQTVPQLGRDQVLEDPSSRQSPKSLLENTSEALASFFVGEAEAAPALPAKTYKPRFVDRPSPRNSHRAVRPDTRYIILHTTEGGSSGSLAKLVRNGEANYMVDRDGTIYRIINRDRIALHSGRSLWNGTRNIDEHSIGIEVVGTYSKDPTEAQVRALRSLVSDLQRIYNVSDERVLTHSMVAYGWNSWEGAYVRGRKKCGMQFADKELREELGLTTAPAYDPDVRAGRVKVIDRRLERALYAESSSDRRKVRSSYEDRNANIVDGERSPWSIAGSAFDDHSTTYQLPSGRKLRGDEIDDWGAIPRGTKVSLGKGQEDETRDSVLEITAKNRTAWSLARGEYRSRSTIYILTDGRVRAGAELKQAELDHLPLGTKVLPGYVDGGNVKLGRTAYEIVGKEWNYPSTYYYIRGKGLVSGDALDDDAIPAGTRVLFRDR